VAGLLCDCYAVNIAEPDTTWVFLPKPPSLSVVPVSFFCVSLSSEGRFELYCGHSMGPVDFAVHPGHVVCESCPDLATVPRFAASI